MNILDFKNWQKIDVDAHARAIRTNTARVTVSKSAINFNASATALLSAAHMVGNEVDLYRDNRNDNFILVRDGSSFRIHLSTNKMTAICVAKSVRDIFQKAGYKAYNAQLIDSKDAVILSPIGEREKI